MPRTVLPSRGSANNCSQVPTSHLLIQSSLSSCSFPLLEDISPAVCDKEIRWRTVKRKRILSFITESFSNFWGQRLCSITRIKNRINSNSYCKSVTGVIILQPPIPIRIQILVPFQAKSGGYVYFSQRRSLNVIFKNKNKIYLLYNIWEIRKHKKQNIQHAPIILLLGENYSALITHIITLVSVSPTRFYM